MKARCVSDADDIAIATCFPNRVVEYLCSKSSTGTPSIQSYNAPGSR
jgi:hypothetical protein